MRIRGKTVVAGVYINPQKKACNDPPLSTKSERSDKDSEAPMGMGASNTEARIAKLPFPPNLHRIDSCRVSSVNSA